MPAFAPSFMIVGLLAFVLLVPMWAAGRSPHVLYRPHDIEIGLNDVVGCDVVREEVVRTLVGSIGLVAAVPITTALTAFVGEIQQGARLFADFCDHYVAQEAQ